MNPSFLLYILVAGILAILAFFLFPAELLLSNQALALGLLVGGIVSPQLAKLFVRTAVQPSDKSSTPPSSFTGERKTLYVGNLPYRASEQEVSDHFASHGEVVSVRLMKDRRTGKRKGYGFVEMAEKDAESAVSALNDTEFQERTLKVRMAKDKQDH
ncbi:RNA recognition motif domain-containing protein [Lacimicrobium alkaliphilum]|uniref:RNA-binding protein n=1 Tax=Lacimicrobium alkaliphilum TaxID=1526571 RepID=A0A0U3ALZ4_9ALTE|nr:RNA-binding protein [Lacimicrobium alkaliphilum]ALS98994.1 RNA-binding protein [Lacimicrobium alkaliphilum]